MLFEGSPSLRVAAAQSMPPMTWEAVPLPAPVEHLCRKDFGSRGDADDARTVVLGGDRAGDVGTVTVVVVGRRPGVHAVLPACGVEIGVVEIDAGVDHRDVGTARPACCAERGRLHAAHTRRRSRLTWGKVGNGAHLAVGRHGRDFRVGLEALNLASGQLRRKPLHCPAIDEPGREAIPALAGLGLSCRTFDRAPERTMYRSGRTRSARGPWRSAWAGCGSALDRRRAQRPPR